MAEPFLGEIRTFAFSRIPAGWSLCDGRLLSINQYMALYSLIGTTYGGDGQTTFGLPDLRGRASMHRGAGYALGQKGGEALHTLLSTEVPAHTHGLRVSASNATAALPTNAILASVSQPMYSAGAPTSQETAVAMHQASIAAAGANQPHENRQPYLTLNICIALMGFYPSRA